MNKMRYIKKQLHKATRRADKAQSSGNENVYSLIRWISEAQRRGT